jgi:hypothetical protein
VAESFQEEFVAALARRSLGAVFVFHPDTYAKGRASRQPADLAWVANGAVLLFTMQSSVVEQHKQDHHNIKQLDGWMRIWAQGVNLRGANTAHAFAISLPAVETVLLVSVTGGAPSTVRVLGTQGRKMPKLAAQKVAATVSILEKVLLELARLGGNTTDLIDLLLQASTSDEELSADDAAGKLLEAKQWAVQKALSTPGVQQASSCTD